MLPANVPKHGMSGKKNTVAHFPKALSNTNAHQTLNSISHFIYQKCLGLCKLKLFAMFSMFFLKKNGLLLYLIAQIQGQGKCAHQNNGSALNLQFFSFCIFPD
uniref:Uncharacterized protein n=1 Tax=Schistocephalus solidus TaxID=70667 RepID=A0A0X3PFL5_SCHSO